MPPTFDYSSGCPLLFTAYNFVRYSTLTLSDSFVLICKAEAAGLTPGTNEYSKFINEQVDPRNIPPTVVEDAIKNTTAVPGNCPGTFMNQTSDITVITNGNGDVITVEGVDYYMEGGKAYYYNKNTNAIRENAPAPNKVKYVKAPTGLWGSTIIIPGIRDGNNPLRQGLDYYIGLDGKAYYYDAVRTVNEGRGGTVDGTNYKNNIKVTNGRDKDTLKAGEDYYVANDGSAYYTGGIMAPGFYWPTESRNISGKFGQERKHRGLDIGVRDVPVYATADGIVVSAGYTKSRGNFIYIDHGNGTQSVYEHLAENTTKVVQGDKVRQGQIISIAGNSGKFPNGDPYPYHLHFELLMNVPEGVRISRIGEDPLWTWPDGGNPQGYHKNPAEYLPK